MMEPTLAEAHTTPELSEALRDLAEAEGALQVATAAYAEAKNLSDFRRRDAERARELYEQKALDVRAALEKTSKTASKVVWIAQYDSTEKGIPA